MVTFTLWEKQELNSLLDYLDVVLEWGRVNVGISACRCVTRE